MKNQIKSITLAALGLATFLLLFFWIPTTVQANHDATGAFVEDTALTGCNHCHNMTITAGNADGSDRIAGSSPSNTPGNLDPHVKRDDWTATVNFMISKGSPSTTAATTYLNTWYTTTTSCPDGVAQGSTCPSGGPGDFDPPTQPTNLSGTPDTSFCTVSLSWTGSTDGVGVTGYNIYRDYDGTNVTWAIGSTSNTITTFTDQGLATGAAYTYQVDAVDAAGNNSTKSSSAVVSTAANCTNFGLSRVSVDNNGTEGNGNSQRSSMDAGGRYITYQSDATNLVSGDTNAQRDAFVHDRVAGTTTRVSVDSSGTQGNNVSSWPSISANSRYISFYSVASNLVAADVNAAADVFVRDLQTGQTVLMSKQAPWGQSPDGQAYELSAVTNSGRCVVFTHTGSNLPMNDRPADANGVKDVWVHDRDYDQDGVYDENGPSFENPANTTRRASEASDGTEANGASEFPEISDDCRYVAFTSEATNLVAGDTNGVSDVFLKDLQTGAIERVSVDTSGTEGDAASFLADMSSDANIISFNSDATNLVTGDSNASRDVFLHNRTTNVTTRISTDSSGTEANGGSTLVSLSEDGRFAGMVSAATNLVTGDTNGVQDVFIKNLNTLAMTRISQSQVGVEGNGISSIPSLSTTGRYVSFWSASTNLVANDTNAAKDVFVRDRGPEETIVDNSAGNQQTQMVAWNATNQEYFSVFHDKLNLDIRGARLDKGGSMLANNLPIVVDGERQAGPWVAYGNGQYMVVWIQGTASGPTGTDVHGAVVGTNGTVTSTFTVTNAANNQRAANVTHDPVNNRFLVLWIDDNGGSTNRDIWGAVLNPDGTAFTAPTLLVTSGTSDQRGPFARFDHGNNQFMLVWFDDRTAGNFDPFRSRLSASGAMLDGSGTAILTDDFHQRNPRITERNPSLGINNFVLAWQDFRNGQPDIIGARLDGNGTKVGDDILISIGGWQQRAATIDIDPVRSDRAVVSWIDNRNKGSDYDIFMAQIDQSGTVTGETFVVGQGTNTINEQRGPLLTYSTANGLDLGFLLIYRDDRATSGDYDLYSQKIYP